MKKIWKKIKHSKPYRDSFVSAHISNTVAAQISLMRDDRGWTQKKLAHNAGMKQSRISALEDPNYENIELETLKRLASAYDVGLTVRFVPFSELVNWSENHDASDLNVPSIEIDVLGDKNPNIRASVEANDDDLSIRLIHVETEDRIKPSGFVRLYKPPKVNNGPAPTRVTIGPIPTNNVMSLG